MSGNFHIAFSNGLVIPSTMYCSMDGTLAYFTITVVRKTEASLYLAHQCTCFGSHRKSSSQRVAAIPILHNPLLLRPFYKRSWEVPKQGPTKGILAKVL